MKRRVYSLVAVLVVCVMAQASGRVKFGQEVSLQVGWNAIYLSVTPDETPDELFDAWPVNFVGAYDASSFLQTKQYSMSASTEGALVGGYRIWQRGDVGATTLKAVAGNTVYLCFATNAVDGIMVYGVPMAPRQTWHVSGQTGSAEGTMNLVGISVAEETTVSEYFDGLSVGSTSYKWIYGLKQEKVQQVDYGRKDVLEMGRVLAINSTKVSDWSGVLNVSPMSGIDFGSDSEREILVVRNDGTKARTVRVTMQNGSAANALEVPPVPMGLMIKDTTTALGAGEWTDFGLDSVFEKKLEAGEEMKLSLAVDRTAYAAGTKGDYYGALLVVKDMDGGSAMRVVVPVEVTSDGGESAATAWPKGIWVLSAELNKVSFVGGEELVTNKVETVDKDGNPSTYEYTEKVKGTRDVVAGGKMKVRLPMAVGGDGSMVLLQRLWYGHDTNGVLHVLAGSAESEVPLYSPRRISTAFLPTDQVKIAAESGGKFGAVARFPFVVGEKSNVNPMRHALHPQHDGLRFDFETASPSGDDLENYIGTIKPEVFSITNVVNLTWTEGEGGTAWSPEETLTGELIWEFGGLRHEGVVRARGSFTMKRISSASLEK